MDFNALKIISKIYYSLVRGVKELFFDVLSYSLNNLLLNNDQQFTYNYNPVSLVYFSLKSLFPVSSQ